MAAKPRASQAAAAATPSKIYKATRGSLGRVVRGAEITEAEAVLERRAGRDIVVCEGAPRVNRAVAQKIENAVGPNERQDPHRSAGPYALPHFQPRQRPPEGHSFYETAGKKAAKNP
jgi:hypothetical protein